MRIQDIMYFWKHKHQMLYLKVSIHPKLIIPKLFNKDLCHINKLMGFKI